MTVSPPKCHGARRMHIFRSVSAAQSMPPEAQTPTEYLPYKPSLQSFAQRPPRRLAQRARVDDEGHCKRSVDKHDLQVQRVHHDEDAGGMKGCEDERHHRARLRVHQLALPHQKTKERERKQRTAMMACKLGASRRHVGDAAVRAT